MRHIQITSPLHSSNVLGTQDRNDPETCKLGGWSLHGKYSEKRGARREERMESSSDKAKHPSQELERKAPGRRTDMNQTLKR